MYPARGALQFKAVPRCDVRPAGNSPMPLPFCGQFVTSLACPTVRFFAGKVISRELKHFQVAEIMIFRCIDSDLKLLFNGFKVAVARCEFPGMQLLGVCPVNDFIKARVGSAGTCFGPF